MTVLFKSFPVLSLTVILVIGMSGCEKKESGRYSKRVPVEMDGNFQTANSWNVGLLTNLGLSKTDLKRIHDIKRRYRLKIKAIPRLSNVSRDPIEIEKVEIWKEQQMIDYLGEDLYRYYLKYETHWARTKR